MSGQRQRKVWLVLATALSVLLVSTAYFFGWFNNLQAQLTDRFLVPSAAPKDIIIVDIDEASLEAIGQWPWERRVHAKLLQQIKSAKVVGFDVIFSEKSASGIEDDQQFAAAIADFDGVVVIPQVIDEQSGLVKNSVIELPPNATTGYVNTTPDRDGVVRRTTLYRDALPSFDIKVTEAISAESGPENLFIYYAGPAKTYTTLSYADVYNGLIPPSIFKDKLILVGASAAGLGDVFQTPFGAMSGVEIRANTITTIRSGITVEELPLSWSLGSFGLIALFVFLLISYGRSWLQIYALLLAALVAIIVGTYTFFAFHLIAPHLYQVLLFLLTTGTLLLLQYVFEANEKRFIRRGFEQYVAPAVVAELTNNPEKLTLVGEERTLSILFSDIRGFTTISEKLTPSQLMNQLNEYLEEMSEAVMERQGLVDKYIGDAVMAFWGAPLVDPDHAKNACESVIAMMEALERLNERWAKEGKLPFKIGVGISTGDVVVGNMGSKRRFNYSIIGDEVNFSARIEGLTKQYGVSCLIGQNTYESIKNLKHLPTRELDDVMVKGKVEPRRIYELITEPLTEGKKVVLEHFTLGRTHYKSGDFASAIAEFKIALVVDPADGPSQVFLERSKALLLKPPENWNGVFEFKTK
ncbi:MAG TPA: CHASE2 domain-containing protein [Candidatus Paceibacterota bacterium]|nr:CHASE2 domain-containing protein [Candidatus Paceibacterota bacterium]